MAEQSMAKRVRRFTGVEADLAVPMYQRPWWAWVGLAIAIAVTVNAPTWGLIVGAAAGGAVMADFTTWYVVARTPDRTVLLHCAPFTGRPVGVVAELQPGDIVPLGNAGFNVRVRAGTVEGNVPRRWARDLQEIRR